jgi:hypothetical protein
MALAQRKTELLVHGSDGLTQPVKEPGRLQQEQQQKTALLTET